MSLVQALACLASDFLCIMQILLVLNALLVLAKREYFVLDPPPYTCFNLAKYCLRVCWEPSSVFVRGCLGK